MLVSGWTLTRIRDRFTYCLPWRIEWFRAGFLNAGLLLISTLSLFIQKKPTREVGVPPDYSVYGFSLFYWFAS